MKLWHKVKNAASRCVEVVKEKGKAAMALLLGGVGAASALVSRNASATGTDFSSITAGVDSSTIVTAIVAAAGIMAVVAFAAWGAKKLARFF